jgi:hypothetical protein
MKKALTRTIIVFVALTLAMTGFTFAQDVVSDEALREEALAVRKEADTVRKEADAVQKEAVAVRIGADVAQKKADIAALLSRMGWQYNRSGSILVIPAAEMKTENLAAITEDMTVMSRIFDNKLSQAHLTTVRSSWSIGEYDSRLFGRSNGAIEAIYLEGYGALFLMKVNALLSPPPEAPQEKETEEEDTDPLWTQMRQEMYEPEKVVRRRRGDRPEEKYDAEKVEDLKETLIKTLKHAANIRALKPDESVILTVIGKAGQPATSAIERLYEEDYSRYIVTTSRAGTGFSSPTVLTIRAKKADIDAFAEGKLSFDQFTEKTQLLSYSYLGENVGGPSRSSLTNVIYGGRSGRSSGVRRR